MTQQLPFFITPEQLKAISGQTGVQVVAAADTPTHSNARIADALHIAPSQFIDSNPPTQGLLPDVETLDATLSAAGLRNDAHIVVYDQGQNTPAARLAYTLHAMGHEAVSILDGGLKAWIADGYDVAEGDLPRIQPGNMELRPDMTRIATHTWLGMNLDNGGIQLIDNRSPAEYQGLDIRSKQGGHIPGAINIPWTQMLTPEGRLKSLDIIEQLLKKRGVDPEREQVVYCQSHMRSSHFYWVLRTLGFKNVRGYPGAWSDWGNNEDNPVSAQTSV